MSNVARKLIKPSGSTGSVQFRDANGNFGSAVGFVVDPVTGRLAATALPANLAYTNVDNGFTAGQTILPGDGQIGVTVGRSVSGHVELVAGTITNAGYVQWRSYTGARVGYMGYESIDLAIVPELGIVAIDRGLKVTPITAGTGLLIKQPASATGNPIEVQPNGTTTPTFKVDSSGALVLGEDTRLRRTAAKTLTLDDGAGGAAKLSMPGGRIDGTGTTGIWVDFGGAQFFDAASDDWTWRGAGNNRMRLVSGRLLLGPTLPTDDGVSALQVGGAGRFTGAFTVADGNMVTLPGASGAPTYFNYVGSGVNYIRGDTTFSNPGNVTATTFTGAGTGLTGVPDSALSGNIPRLNAANSFTTFPQNFQNGDNSAGGSNLTQLAFSFYGGGYSHHIVSRHNGGQTANNALDFFTSDGSGAGSYPSNAIHGLTVSNGGISVGTKVHDAASRINVTPTTSGVGVNVTGPASGTGNLYEGNSYGGTAGDRFAVTSAGNITTAGTVTINGTSNASVIVNNVNNGSYYSFLQFQNGGVTSSSIYSGGLSTANPYSLTFNSTYSSPHLFLMGGTEVSRIGSSGTFAQTLTSPSAIGHSINLAPSQSANAINVTSNGGTAGDIFKVTAAGIVSAPELLINGATHNSLYSIRSVGNMFLSSTDSTELGLHLKNTTSTAQTNVQVENDGNVIWEMGINGNSVGSYGAMGAGDAYHYTVDPTVLLAIDNAAAVYKIALGFGVPEIARFSAGGAFKQTLISTSSVGHTIQQAASATGDYFRCLASDGTTVKFAVTAAGIGFSQGWKYNPISAPSLPVEGQMYYDSTDHALKIYDGSAWKTVQVA